ncbi:leucine-rich repeat protein [Mycoplasma sp. SK341A]|uniref:leucine-rich repeat protein n=1 Tax=Mycoplasma sp. SK341A TaxID=3401679 RepID=UPI003AB0FA16
MKHNKIYILLTLASVSSLATLPLIASSCNNDKADLKPTVDPGSGTGDGKGSKQQDPNVIALKSSDPNIKMDFNKETKVLTIANAPTVDYDLLSSFITQLNELFKYQSTDITLSCPDTTTICTGYLGESAAKITKLIMPKLQNTYGHIFRLFNTQRDWLFKNLVDDKVVLNGMLVKWDNASGNLEDNTITQIAQYAFLNTQDITGISFPNLQNIQPEAFGLNERNIFPKITDKLVVNGILIKYPNAKGVIEDDTIKQVYGNVFNENKDITSISLPNATKVDYYSFNNATNLTTVSLPKAEIIGNSAFYGASSLKELDLPKVTTVGEYAFSNATSLEKINLPLVKSIDKFAFDITPKLANKLVFNTILAKWTDASGDIKDDEITSIIGGIFKDNDKITSLSFSKVTNITESLAQNAKKLTSITFPSAISIQAHAFQNDSSLTTIQAPNVTRIEDYAFEKNTALETISFHKATYIGARAFADDTSLTSVSLPSAKYIHTSAFDGADKLKNVPTVVND